uniref:Probable molybdopterin-synthase adenylyltransferase n=1 Tax=Antithamnion hubbsii TaxID=1005974 RepID=A0A4D6WKS4_9FLOR|nr:Molybdopterin biosynthesis protein [Antithamnion hubbsii]
MFNTKNNYINNLTKKEYKQYSRQLILENIGINGQIKLKKARVLVIGIGGLGCPAITYLTNAGIGKIGIIDNDIVDLSNLNRQILYNQDNIGQDKVNCTHVKMKKINEKCIIKTYNYKINKDNARNIIQHYDIIIDATDNFHTRYIIDEICYQLHKIHIYGAINRYEGQVSIFNYKNNLRYSDIYPKNLRLNNLDCNTMGVLGIMTGTIGILQATECIKIILGIGKLLNGTLLIYNLLNVSFKKIKIFPIKKRYKYYNTDSVLFLNKKLVTFNNNKYNNSIILDVRQETEFISQHLHKSINIPLLHFKSQATLYFIQNHCKHKTIFLYCHTLSRSITVSYLLTKNYIEHYIMND